MSNRDRNVGNQDAGGFSRGRDPNDHRANIQPRRLGGIARKNVEPLHPRLGLATKAARKTFAEPPTDLDSQDEHSDRSTRMRRPSPNPNAAPDRLVFATKSGQTISAISRGRDSNQPASKATRRVSFDPDAQAHPSASGAGKSSVPVRGLIGQSIATSSQTHPPFVSKSTNQTISRRDPFSSGTPSRATGPIRLAQSYSPLSSRPAYGFGISNPRFPAQSTNLSSSSSRFPSIPVGESISSAGRNTFSKGNRHLTPPSKSRPLPPLEAIENATWRKGISSRKTSMTYSGIEPAPRMTAPSMSTPQRKVKRTSVAGDQLRPEDVGPTYFLGSNMTIYENNVAVDSDGEEIAANVSKQGGTAITKVTSRTLPMIQIGRKAGKYDNTSRVHSSSDSSQESSEYLSESSEDDDDEMESDADEPDTGSESDLEVVARPASPSNDLIAALEAFTLPSLRMQKTGQLPFLLRNLRRGFADRCHLLGISTKPAVYSDKASEVQLIFRLQPNDAVLGGAEDYSDEYKTRMTSWNCPLCDLHGCLGTQLMLQKHIEWDHFEIGTIWTRDIESTWTIIFYVPKPYTNLELAIVPIHDEPQQRSLQLHSPPPSAPVLSPVSPNIPTMQPATVPAPESPVHSKLKQRAPSPPRPVTRFMSQTSLRSRSRSATLTSSRAQTREPSSQPPLEDLLGPSAQFPYLPENSEVYFSCRPGSPRIYDILNALPLAPFGVLSWFIVDREEELFELDDVLDEDKVMQALWGRWIILNHRKFLANYYNGTVAFIDEYWRMIHRAAGWAALRVWLLMFVVNRFLTGSEVAHILRHYEGLTNMDSWYTDQES